eukprot:SAG11_NODE_9233_length_930_cov_4.567990_1_plen_180_part_00
MRKELVETAAGPKPGLGQDACCMGGTKVGLRADRSSADAEPASPVRATSARAASASAEGASTVPTADQTRSAVGAAAQHREDDTGDGGSHGSHGPVRTTVSGADRVEPPAATAHAGPVPGGGAGPAAQQGSASTTARQKKEEDADAGFDLAEREEAQLRSDGTLGVLKAPVRPRQCLRQ